jgi:predicted nucleic acid-binding protein
MGTLNEAIVDSSVIIAHYVPEKYSDWATQKMTEYNSFHVLDLDYYEVANVLKHMVPKRLTLKEAETSFSEALELMNQFTLHSFSAVINHAYVLAAKLEISVYDAAFVSLSELFGIQLLTLDIELAKKLMGTEYCSFLEYPRH